MTRPDLVPTPALWSPLSAALDAYESALTSSIFDEQDCDAEQAQELAVCRASIEAAREQLALLDKVAKAANRAVHVNPGSKSGLRLHGELGESLVELNGAPLAYRGYLNPNGEPYRTLDDVAAVMRGGS